MYYRDTIVAISTPIGEGGIGIVRLSGDEAIAIAERIFRSPSGKKLNQNPHKSLLYGHIISPETNHVIDEVLVSTMKAPHTYTTEDVVEINVHSGNLVLREVLRAVLLAGARLAEPGEFTKRAFLNGRIDLSQAEAVIDVIRATAPPALRLAERQLEGYLSKKVKEIREELLDVAVQLEAAVDFSEEENIEILPYTKLITAARAAKRKIEALLINAESGRVFREGIQTAIIGSPNVGKSSLFNLLLKENRAIVTSVPGTTRDIIEEKVDIHGICLNLRDTAGIRDPLDEVEKIGVQLSHASLRRAQLVLLVIDLSQSLSEEDEKVISSIKRSKKKTLVVANKADLPMAIEAETLEKKLEGLKWVKISAKTGAGLKKLEKLIVDVVFEGVPLSEENTLVTNVRHIKLLQEAKSNVEEALRLLKSKAPEELAATIILDCLDNLGEITGETASIEIVDKIFSQFCIGK